MADIEPPSASAAPKRLSFAGWYLLDRPREIIALYMRYAQAFSEMFAIVFLLKTLFSPWKSIRENYPDKGFDLAAILEAWSLNVTTRAIGAVIRLATILAGLLLQIVVLSLFVVYVCVWVLFPVLLLVGIPLLVILIAQ